MSRGNRVLTCLLATIVFLGLALGLETCGRAMVATARIKAEARVAIAHERTVRAEGRHETLRCLLRRAPCEG